MPVPYTALVTMAFWLCVITNVNPNLNIPKMPLNYITILLGVTLFFIKVLKTAKVSKVERNIIILIICFIPSVLNSEYTDVAAIKLIIFSLGMLGVNAICEYASKSTSSLNSLQTSVFISIAFSIIVMLLNLGYTVNKTGFSGILVHPQSYGILISLSLVLVFTFNQEIGDYKKSIILMMVMLFLSYSTESRAAMISSIVAISYYVLMSKNKVSTNFKANVKKILILLALMGLVVTFGERVISKSGRSTANSAVEALQDSRLRFAISSIENFLENPITGIGFQVSNGKGAHYEMLVERGVFGIPVKAVVEKGTFPPALLEEVGLIGAIGFMFFILYLFKTNRNMIFRSTLLLIILLSFGEATLFSFGGVGLFNWLFLYSTYHMTKNEKLNT